MGVTFYIKDFIDPYENDPIDAPNAISPNPTFIHEDEKYEVFKARYVQDSTGQIHSISFERASPTGSGYVWYNAGREDSWATVEVIDDLVQPGGGSCKGIDVDSNDAVHLFYDDWYNNIYYQTNATGSWVKTKIWDSGDGNVDYNAGELIVDGDNKIHVFFGIDPADDQLTHGTNATGSWQFETLDTEQSITSVRGAIMSDDTFVIVYIRKEPYPADYTLEVMTGTWGSWSQETITTVSGRYGTGLPDIDVDSGDNIHLAYCSYDGDQDDVYVHYNTNATGSWVETTIETGTNQQYYYELTVDFLDKIHFTVFDPDSGDPRYYTNVPTLTEAYGNFWDHASTDGTYAGGKWTAVSDPNVLNLYAGDTGDDWGDTLDIDTYKFSSNLSTVTVDMWDKDGVNFYSESDARYVTHTVSGDNGISRIRFTGGSALQLNYLYFTPTGGKLKNYEYENNFVGWFGDGTWAWKVMNWRGNGAYESKVWYHGGANKIAEIAYYHYDGTGFEDGLDYLQETLPS